MKSADLHSRVPENGIFRTGQILAGEKSPADVRSQLSRWVRSGRVIQLRRQVYALAEPYRKSAPHPFAVANALRRSSYVSLQSALAYYGMIPEYVPVVTSVTTGRPEEITNPLGRFQFRHVSVGLFRGFADVEVSSGQRILMATPQKALVDLLYLTPHSDEVAFLEELRIQRSRVFDAAALRVEAAHSGSAKVLRAVERLERLPAEEV
jgi:predicted transcriptional regulator of viral defense system